MFTAKKNSIYEMAKDIRKRRTSENRKGAVTDKSQPRHKKYTQFYREEGVFFGIIYV